MPVDLGMGKVILRFPSILHDFKLSQVILISHTIESKKSNVVLSADLTTTKDLLAIADSKKVHTLYTLP